ncbi:GDP-mannose mannosyl hydrolase [Marinimicrobium locisalis]|uniref:GDP-mannose mannosyl hydrolase n=1 Tax=Marinimicrobium locisalis TaxID=546022 RepID=UPI0032214B0A
MFLAEADFKNVIKHSPMFSIDLVIINNGKVLLGRRLNRPAKGYWFVPGGRVRKGEPLNEAAERISLSELGISLDYSNGRSLGVFEHFYKDSVYGEAISTHYIAHGVQFKETVDLRLLPKDQHDSYGWWAISEALASDEVHRYTKSYLR